jgi:hypothetical protein
MKLPKCIPADTYKQVKAGLDLVLSHWVASGNTIDQLNDLIETMKAGAAPAPAPAKPASDVIALKVPSRQAKGPQAFIWRPKSDSDGKLAVVLPAKYGKATAVKVGTTELRFSAIANENRAHYRGGKAGAGYGAAVNVTFTAEDGQKYIVYIPDTSREYNGSLSK